ncbi:MAG: transglycosylase SLT domain-containing protein [Candidatus Margulisiibacteriota bacterium]
MDGTSIAIVLLFVIAIFSSMPNQPPGQAPSEVVGPRSELFKVTISAADIPPANYFIPPGQNLESNICDFITAYARPANRGYAPQIAGAIMKYSQEYDVNPRLLTALIARESRFNPQAVSSHGALGLGQLLPQTASSMGAEDAFDVDQNVKATTRYLKYLLDKWQDENMQVPLALASYLAGPNAIKQTTGLSDSTHGYVADILQLYNRI